MFDVFISYRHGDAAAVTALARALSAAGLRVWQDATEIEDFASIQGAIAAGLSHAKALLAWYSSRYPQSLACQWELTYAFIAAQQEGDPRQRVLIVNPEASNTHIHPVELRDALYRTAAAPDALDAAAAAIRAHVERLSGCFGDIAARAAPRWYGAPAGDGSSRFFGRLAEMWAIHSGLWSAAAPIITDRNARPLVRLTGMAGSGKSLTAETYALRYAAAYPGGIVWLRAFGHDVAAPAHDADELRDSQLMDVAQQLGIAAVGRAALGAAIDGALAARGHYLWVVDDLPSGMIWRELQSWLAPGAAGHTLVTTRNANFDWAGSEVRLDSLDEMSALALLTHGHLPANEQERADALALARDLDCHALALELAAVAVRVRGFKEFRASLATPARDALDFAAELLKARAGSAAQRDAANLNLSQSLLMSVDALDARGQDLLRLAAGLAPVRLERGLVAASLAAADSLASDDAEQVADIAMASVNNAALARELPGGAILVHPLVSRTMRFRDTLAERSVSLRRAALGALETALGEHIFDARQHGPLADYIAHARHALAQSLDAPQHCELAELRLLDALYIYDLHHGDYAEAGRVAECLIAWATQRLGEEHAHTLIFTSYLGEVRRMQGRLGEAYDIHYKLLQTRSRLLDPDTLVSANNLALVMQQQGDAAGARELLEMVYRERLKSLGEEHPATLLAMHNLAAALTEQGELEAARVFAERALELRRNVLGPAHRDTQESQLSAANIARKLGQAGAARALDAAAVELRGADAGTGDMNPDRLTAMNNLAVSLHGEGKFAQACTLMQQVCSER
ncbi:MAG: toll/interleukin-1 receptor domain-containing protein, partial [Rhodocyclaceae bacterium]|nr:toll/interleukin-1 receptor domain-containing protein [Rhodocyclaceae bacterium]